jgi:ribosomal-protein-alanine N-acetyltransferase
MASAIIRPAEAKDIQALVALEAAAFPHPWDKDNLARLISDETGICSVAVLEDDTVSGYISCQCVGCEMEIHRIAVAQEFRRMGTGELLVKNVLERAGADNIRDVFLEVASLNAPAVRLYQKLGFKRIYTRKKYYAHTGDDAVIMKKEMHKK